MRPLLGPAVVAGALLVGALAGCSSPGPVGAVLVRWRLLAGSEGNPQSQCVVCIGGCLPGQNVCTGSCPHSGGAVVTVDEVELQVADAKSGQPVACDGCRFSCQQQEGTTPFTIPEGSYLFSLRALSCGQPFGQTPPPVLRDIAAGQITNLNAIEILVPDDTPVPVCNGG